MNDVRTLRRWLLRNDRGSVTAEFAITVPAVLLVLGLVIGSVALSAERVALVSLAGELARLEARGDTELAAASLAAFASQPRILRENDGRVLCITAASGERAGLLAPLRVSGTGCAAVTSVMQE